MATNTLQISPGLAPRPQCLGAMRPSDLPALSSRPARRLALARHQVFTIKNSDGIRAIKILRGTIWLTATPGGKDILLTADNRFAIGSQAPFVLEALADAEIILHL